MPPRKPSNASRRTREYLTPTEVESLIRAAEQVGRHGLRDGTMILTAYRHGLRVSELCSLRWEQVDLDQGLLHVCRCKNGTPSAHPVNGRERHALRKLRNESGDRPHVFCSERNAPISPSRFRKVIARAGRRAGLLLSVHPHMLRHATGYKLVNDGHDTRAIQHYLGHKNIAHTVRYTELAPGRFRDFWED